MTSDQKRAIITGASSGIGKATAIAFAKAGIDVILIGRSLDQLKETASAAKAVGVEAKFYVVDLAKVEQVKDKISAIASEVGRVDILVNNAGMGYTNTLEETPLEDWQEVINLNLTSPFQCILGVLPQMRNQSSGIIVNIASIVAATPFPGWGAYSVSKAGLVALAKTLTAEERDNGIRVVTISPGAVNTPVWDTKTVNADLNRSAMLSPETVAQSILHTVLLPPEALIEELTITPSAGTL